jgi:hypothetical protein
LIKLQKRKEFLFHGSNRTSSTTRKKAFPREDFMSALESTILRLFLQKAYNAILILGSAGNVFGQNILARRTASFLFHLIRLVRRSRGVAPN